MIDHWISLQPCGDPRWGGAARLQEDAGLRGQGISATGAWMGVFFNGKDGGVTSMGIHMNMVKHQLKRNQKIFHAFYPLLESSGFQWG